MTAAPSAAHASATARPMPRPAPVTAMTLSSRIPTGGTIPDGASDLSTRRERGQGVGRHLVVGHQLAEDMLRAFLLRLRTSRKAGGGHQPEIHESLARRRPRRRLVHV